MFFADCFDDWEEKAPPICEKPQNDGAVVLLYQKSAQPVAITFWYQRKESLGIRRPVG